MFGCIRRDNGGPRRVLTTYTVGQIALSGRAIIAAAYLTYVRAFKR